MRSYFKFYTDDINFPRYLADEPANDTDVEIYFRRKNKEQFLADVTPWMWAWLIANFPPPSGSNNIHWQLTDGTGAYLGYSVLPQQIALAGYDFGPYSEHPLD